MEAIQVEVFSTNIKEPKEAEQVIRLLSVKFPGCRINMDLEDCDKILRIEGGNFMASHIIKLLHLRGYYCALLQ